MSIYIKGMEMPTRWSGFDITIYPDGSCISEDGLHYTAVPVPPHGRLIDADALAGHTVTEWFCGNKRIYVPWKDVTDAPTIIPADKVKGGTT